MIYKLQYIIWKSIYLHFKIITAKIDIGDNRFHVYWSITEYNADFWFLFFLSSFRRGL